MDRYIGAPTTHNTLPYLSSTNGGPKLPPIQQLKGWHTNARMMAVVVRKLCQGKIRVPTPTEIQHTCSEHVLERLNRSLTLPVSLWVVCGTKMQSRTQFLMKRLPESGSETYISILDNRDRHPMPRYHLPHVYLCQPLRGRALTNSNEMSALR